MFKTLPVSCLTYFHVHLSHIPKVWMDTYTRSRTHKHSHYLPSSLNRGVSDPLSFLYSHSSRAKEIFLSLFFPLQTFFSPFFPLLLFLFSEPAPLVLTLIPPPLSPPSTPPPLPGPPASSLEWFPESTQINECKSVCVHVCVWENEGERMPQCTANCECVSLHTVLVLVCVRVWSVVSKPNFILWNFFFLQSSK